MTTNWRRDYEDIRRQFIGVNFGDFRRGHWFAKFVRAILRSYENSVDANYIARHYPGLPTEEKAQKIIQLAARHCGYIGSASAAAVTAAQLSALPSGGATLPVAAAAIMADVAATARVFVRAAYDLSVIQEAPLSADDYEDCDLLFRMAMGIAAYERATVTAGKVLPRVLEFNLRRLLRSGLRTALVSVAQRAGGTQLARRLTERALMRVAVPGISVPISGFMNREFAYAFLQNANMVMRKRGAVIRPVIRMFREQPDTDRSLPIRTVIAMVEVAGRKWNRDQVALLRYCQAVLKLSDEELRNIEERYDRTSAGLFGCAIPDSAVVARSLVEIATVTAAVWPNGEQDAAYANTLEKLAKAVHVMEWTPIPAMRDRLNREPVRSVTHELLRARGRQMNEVSRLILRRIRSFRSERR
jgi:hypothetical protein